MKKVKVSIAGVTGVTGEELVKVLLNHRFVEIKYLLDQESFVGENFIITTNGQKFTKKILSMNTFDILNKIDVIFLCLPHNVSMKYVAQIYKFFVEDGMVYNFPKIIDLSADFRIKNLELYKQFYKQEHVIPELVKKFVYGLPEIYSKKIRNARFIANPGCYPTTVILGLAPLLKIQNVRIKEILIDSKSGYSGGGRKLISEYESYGGGNTYAYNVNGEHRHIPEIEEQINMLSGQKNLKIIFVPHVIPQFRGMFSSIYVKLDKKIKIDYIFETYRKFYKNKNFIKILDLDKITQTKNVINTNYCYIGFGKQERYSQYWISIFVTIDNLIKGAVGQAVQNMNLMFGFDEKEGLI